MMPDSDPVYLFFRFIFYTLLIAPARAKCTEVLVLIKEHLMFRLYYPPPRFSLLNVNRFIKAVLANHLCKNAQEG